MTSARARNERSPMTHDHMKLSDLNLLDVGNTIGLVGAIFDEEGHTYLCFFPEKGLMDKTHIIDMDDEDWKKFLRQTDLLETEILEMAPDGKLAKAIYRKTQRLIEARVSWAVFKRDHYTCRYCGKDGIPLTVDHLVLWEEGGPSIPENLVAACRKCNKIRGNMQYPDWLKSEKYKQLSKTVLPRVKDANMLMAHKLDAIPRNYHQRSRNKGKKGKK